MQKRDFLCKKRFFAQKSDFKVQKNAKKRWDKIRWRIVRSLFGAKKCKKEIKRDKKR